MIPRIFHQTWKTKDLDPCLNHWHESWKSHHSDYKFKLYDDQEALGYIKKKAPEYLNFYLSLAPNVCKADFFRYIVVYHEGGIYADIDMECFKSISPLINNKSAVLSIEAFLTSVKMRELSYSYPWQVANCIFAFAPRHPFLKGLIKSISSITKTSSDLSNHEVEDWTGPRHLTRFYQQNYSEDLPLLHPIFLMTPKYVPIWPGINQNTFSRHHCQGSWKKAVSKVSMKWNSKWKERDLIISPWPRQSMITKS